MEQWLYVLFSFKKTQRIFFPLRYNLLTSVGMSKPGLKIVSYKTGFSYDVPKL